jgi:methyl-accepting chemotaxis protein
MIRWWKKFGLQARFMAISGVAVLVLAACTLAIVIRFEVSSLEDRLRTFSENELRSLNALVESAMEQRLRDPENVAIKVFDGWFESRNQDYPGQLWSVWGPKVTAYVAQTDPQRSPKPPHDSVDAEALRSGQPVGRFIGDTYRYSLPIVLGRLATSRGSVCATCHGSAMGIKDGEVIAVVSSSISAGADLAALQQLLWMMAAGAISAVIFVMVGIRLIFARVITRPLTGMTAAMRQLADGDKEVEIPAQDRLDEIGDMAGALLVFKTNMIEADQLRIEQKESEARAIARREQDMRSLARDFQGAIGDIVDVVSSAATELEATSATLAKTAEINQQLSVTVAETSEQTSMDVQSVASASEELDSSLKEIARQVQESRKIASDAADQARKTDSRITELSEAALKISDVIKLITGIAEQTNLLALNATIEAARAGDAGRGFAVVAQEVKALATQTAKATSGIVSQISEMQTATQDSVVAIRDITTTIGKISEIATMISASIEEQGSATQEISRNVVKVAQDTADVAGNITEVSRAATQTGSASVQVLGSAQILSNESNRLKAEVDKFLSTFRNV